MTILLVSHTSALDGAERSLAALALCLHKQQISCRVICPGPGPLPDLLRINQIPVTLSRLPRPQKDALHLLIFVLMWPLVVMWLSWWLHKNHISVVYNNTIDGLYAPFATRLAGIPCVWHIREVKPQNLSRRRLFIWLLRRLPQQTVFNSQATMKAYGDQPTPHWHVVYNGVPIPDDPVKRPPDQAVVIGFAGQLVPHKRPDLFLQAFAQAKEQIPALEAIIAGNGPLLLQLRELVNQLQLDDSIKMPGYIDNMSTFYTQIDILVLTSEKEPFGRVVAEAMAVGCPVVASRVDGVSEVLNETCGFLVDPGKASNFAKKIVLLANEPSMRLRLGAAGRIRAQSLFSEKQCCEKLTHLLTNEILTV